MTQSNDTTTTKSKGKRAAKSVPQQDLASRCYCRWRCKLYRIYYPVNLLTLLENGSRNVRQPGRRKQNS